MKRKSLCWIALLIFMLSSNLILAQQHVPFVFSITKLKSDSTKYQAFYDFLLGERFPYSMVGTLPEFTNKIKDRNHAVRLYEGLRKRGYSEITLGSEAQFVKKFCE